MINQFNALQKQADNICLSPTLSVDLLVLYYELSLRRQQLEIAFNSADEYQQAKLICDKVEETLLLITLDIAIDYLSKYPDDVPESAQKYQAEQGFWLWLKTKRSELQSFERETEKEEKLCADMTLIFASMEDYAQLVFAAPDNTISYELAFRRLANQWVALLKELSST